LTKDLSHELDYLSKEKDALRYEVAAVLAEQLRRETQSKVALESRQGIFPTITKFGMAALLPHKALSVQLKGSALMQVLADGKTTEAGDRDGILKAANPASVALKYKDIIDMKRVERSALVKGMDVVYIYHDRIDEASHTDDTQVFAACEQAIQEIKTLVRIIVNEFSGTRILITADHGFLYTYSPLTEDGKVSSDIDGRTVDKGRRHIIAEKDAQAEYLMPVRFLEDSTPYAGFAPRENIRLKLSGAGVNFVHGGVSLQELVVPVIDYHYLRTDSKDFRRNRDKANGNRISGSISTATKDYIINYQDLQGIGMTGKLALPSLIALCSIALARPTLGSLAVLGEISISGTIIKVDELANTLQCCLDSGAKKVLIPSVSMIDFATVPADLMGAFQLIPYSSAEDAVFKALGVE